MAMVEMRQVAPFRDANAVKDDTAALRAIADEDGYLYFRGLLPESRVLEVRRQLLELCAKHGWLDPSAPLMDGVAHPNRTHIEGHTPQWQAFYRDALKLRDFHALALSREILGALERVFSGPVLNHSRNICRVMFPSTRDFTTPPHQDHLYIGGTEETWTCWAPLGDCPEELGGLCIWPGSHKRGLLPSRPGKGAGGRQVDVEPDALWVSDEMDRGDVLLFHSLTVHQARDNQSENRLRLSVDYRYQPVSLPVRRDSLEPHMAGFGLTWEDIYADWSEDDPIRYFWKRMNLDIIEASAL